MNEWIDISIPTDATAPAWPGSPGFAAKRHLAISEGDDANATQIEMDVHVGTHVDAPLHFVDGAEDIAAVGLKPFIGRAVLAGLDGINPIEAGDLEALDLDPGIERLLLRTHGSSKWFLEAFEPGASALAPSGAEWIADRGIALVGIDWNSIQRYGDGPETHQVLLRNNVCILEGLDLSRVEPGTYDLICLPIKLAGVEAAPARAAIRSVQ